MARGGARDGAGRKPGVANKASIERQAEVAASGLTPLEYMLGILRDETLDEEFRFEAAKAAAPYVHPKLAAVEHSGSLDVTTQTKEQRDAAVAAATRADR